MAQARGKPGSPEPQRSTHRSSQRTRAGRRSPARRDAQSLCRRAGACYTGAPWRAAAGGAGHALRGGAGGVCGSGHAHERRVERVECLWAVQRDQRHLVAFFDDNVVKRRRQRAAAEPPREQRRESSVGNGIRPKPSWPRRRQRRRAPQTGGEHVPRSGYDPTKFLKTPLWPPPIATNEIQRHPNRTAGLAAGVRVVRCGPRRAEACRTGSCEVGALCPLPTPKPPPARGAASRARRSRAPPRRAPVCRSDLSSAPPRRRARRRRPLTVPAPPAPASWCVRAQTLRR